MKFIIDYENGNFFVCDRNVIESNISLKNAFDQFLYELQLVTEPREPREENNITIQRRIDQGFSYANGTVDFEQDEDQIRVDTITERKQQQFAQMPNNNNIVTHAASSSTSTAPSGTNHVISKRKRSNHFLSDPSSQKRRLFKSNRLEQEDDVEQMAQRTGAGPNNIGAGRKMETLKSKFKTEIAQLAHRELGGRDGESLTFIEAMELMRKCMMWKQQTAPESYPSLTKEERNELHKIIRPSLQLQSVNEYIKLAASSERCFELYMKLIQKNHYGSPATFRVLRTRTEPEQYEILCEMEKDDLKPETAMKRISRRKPLQNAINKALEVNNLEDAAAIFPELCNVKTLEFYADVEDAEQYIMDRCKQHLSLRDNRRPHFHMEINSAQYDVYLSEMKNVALHIDPFDSNLVFIGVGESDTSTYSIYDLMNALLHRNQCNSTVYFCFSPLKTRVDFDVLKKLFDSVICLELSPTVQMVMLWRDNKLHSNQSLEKKLDSIKKMLTNKDISHEVGFSELIEAIINDFLGTKSTLIYDVCTNTDCTVLKQCLKRNISCISWKTEESYQKACECIQQLGQDA
jgi:hypothetical protein